MRFRLLARTFVLGLGAAVFACSSDPEGTNPDPHAPPNGATDAGPTGDELPKTCEGLVDALKQFSSTHTSCDDANPCQNVDDLGHSAVCSLSFSPGADAEHLRRLKEQFTKLDCGNSVECAGGGPVTVSCNQGTCGFRDPGKECQECPTNVDPVCTVGGRNSRNSCTAAKCDGEAIKHEGYCETGPTCASKGGTCQVLKAEAGAWYCPEGQRFEPLDMMSDCASGYFENTCCRPGWSFPCTYLGVFSSTLSLDPFTCKPAKNPVCLFGASMESCSVAGEVGLSRGEGKIDRLDDQTTLTVETGARLKVKGHAANGRTFECSGVASAEIMGEGASWACKACLGDACETCTINQTSGCQLP